MNKILNPRRSRILTARSSLQIHIGACPGYWSGWARYTLNFNIHKKI